MLKGSLPSCTLYVPSNKSTQAFGVSLRGYTPVISKSESLKKHSESHSLKRFQTTCTHRSIQTFSIYSHYTRSESLFLLIVQAPPCDFEVRIPDFGARILGNAFLLSFISENASWTCLIPFLHLSSFSFTLL